MSNHSNHQPRSERGVALLTALIVLLLISAAGAIIMFMSGGESSLVGNQRAYTVAWDAAVSGLEEARARLSVTDPNFISSPATSITFPAATGDVLYILNNPAGDFTVNDVTNSSSLYYDWEYDQEWGTGALANAVTASKVQSVSSDTLLSSLSGMLPPIPYKWVRATILTEKAANRDINGDSVLDNTIPVFYDASTNTQNVTTASPRPGNTVYRLTSLALLPNGTSSVVQYDAGPGVPMPPFPAAVSVCGPNVNFSKASSANWVAQGVDQAVPPGPALAGFGTCGATAASTVTTAVTTSPDRSANYTGASGATPNVVDVSGTMGSCLQSVSCLQNLVATITTQADQVLPNNPPCPFPASSPPNLITVVQGDLSCSGLTQGAGILVVTGTLSLSGNFSFDGIVLVVGQGILQASGGGSGSINGTVFVAKTLDASGNPLASLGTPTFNWGGGGGNGISFNSQSIKSAKNRFPYRVIGFREISR